ncbi:MAG: RDD family protein [Chitinophagales bacterium]
MEVVSSQRFAGFTRRFIAFIIDRFFISIVVYGLILEFADGPDMWNLSNLFSIHSLAAEALIMLYFVLMETSNWQATLGKKLMGLRVVDQGFGKITNRQAFYRFISKYLSMGVLLLGFIWIIFDDRKQGWHDKIAETYVIV